MDGFRSADPPTTHGTFLAMALSTCPELSRVASPFASAGNVGMSLSQPAGKLALLHRVELGGQLRDTWLVYSSKSFRHAAWASAPRLPMPFLKRSYTPSGTRNWASSGQP